MPDEEATPESQEAHSDVESTPRSQPGEDSEAGPPLPPAGTQEEDPTAALREQLAALTGQVEALVEQRDEARAEAVDARTASEQATSRILDLSPQVLAATRRALLAENPDAVPELIQGDTPEALEASVADSRDVYARIRERLQAEAAAQVPTGASAGAPIAMEDLTPIQKLTQAFNRNSRG